MILNYRLDNPARLFAAVSTRKNSFVYRVCAVMHEPINPALLQAAVDEIHSRFPMFFVRIWKGVFWNYTDGNKNPFRVMEDFTYPCSPIDIRENEGYMLRVLYYGNTISVEFFHALTDGSGVMEFLKSLVLCYLKLLGKEVDGGDLILKSKEGTNIDETEDAYRKYFSASVTLPYVEKEHAYRITGASFPQFGNNTVTGIMSASVLNRLAKRHGATVTSFLSAVLATSIIKAEPSDEKKKKPIVISVPVNLRKAFPSETLRNFFGVVNLKYRSKDGDSLGDIVESMTRQLREKTTVGTLHDVVAQNTAMERNIFSRFVPLGVKRIFMGLGFDLFGERKKTITLSNLGNIVVPQSVASYIDRFEFYSYTTKINPMICAICSLGDKLCVSFTRSITEPDIIRHFFMLLSSEEELDVTVRSNEWGESV